MLKRFENLEGDMGLLGKIFGESKRTQDYNLKMEAIKRDIALSKNNTVDVTDNLILATQGIDQQGGIVSSNNSVKVLLPMLLLVLLQVLEIVLHQFTIH